MRTAAKGAGRGKYTLPGTFVAHSAPVTASPVAGPNDPIGLKVEIYVNSAWADISPFVYYRSGSRVKVTRGKPDETSAPPPQTCTFIINNRDGRFSPRNPLSPYYGLIGRNTPVRVSRLQNGIRRYRFHGEIPAWPTDWDISGTDVIASVTAAGQMRRLSQGDAPLGATLFRAFTVSADGSFMRADGTRGPLPLAAYWPCQEGALATSIASGIPGAPAMTLSGQAAPKFAQESRFLCSDPLPLLSGSIWAGTVPPYSGGVDNLVDFLLAVPDTGAFDTAVLCRLTTAGPVNRVDLTYLSAGNGSLQMLGYSTSGALLFTSSAVTDVNGGLMDVRMQLVQSGADILWILFVDSVVQNGTGGGESFGTLTSTRVGNATSVVINPDGHINDTAVGHISVQYVYATQLDSVQPRGAWLAEDPDLSTTPELPSRFTRLCIEQGVPAVVIPGPATNEASVSSNGYGLIYMGAQMPGTFLDLIQQPVDTACGLLFESRDQAALVLRTRGSLYNQAARLTLDYTQHQLSAASVPVDDDALTRNNVTVTKIDGSSAVVKLTSGALSVQPPPNGVGDYPKNYPISLFADSDLPDQAGWRLHMGTVDEPRYPQISINLRHPAFTSNLDLMNAAIGTDIGDRLVITNPPPWLPPDAISQIVQGYTEVLGIFEHDLVFNGAPESPYRVAILEDTVLGRADTDGSTLAIPVGPAATTLAVATTSLAGAQWTTNPADCPFDVNMGGERVTVTAVANSTFIGSADGSFETGVGGWTPSWGASGTWTSSSAAAHSGTLSGLFTSVSLGAISIAAPVVPVAAGVSYTLTGWRLLQSGSTAMSVSVQWLTSALGFIDSSTSPGGFATGSWQSESVTATAPPQAAFANIRFSGTCSIATGVYIDDMSFTPSASPQSFTVIRSVNGVVKSQTAGTDIRLWQPMILSL